jgi:VIT1/CCC1 family predicted Fe2+/Mn2+ transporter
MTPYFALDDVNHALFVSIGVTVLTLLTFGYVKGRVTMAGQRTAIFSALQTLVVGALAAGVSYGIVRVIDSKDEPL